MNGWGPKNVWRPLCPIPYLDLLDLDRWVWWSIEDSWRSSWSRPFERHRRWGRSPTSRGRWSPGPRCDWCGKCPKSKWMDKNNEKHEMSRNNKIIEKPFQDLVKIFQNVTGSTEISQDSESWVLTITPWNLISSLNYEIESYTVPKSHSSCKIVKNNQIKAKFSPIVYFI